MPYTEGRSNHSAARKRSAPAARKRRKARKAAQASRKANRRP